ncbi:MAG: DUF2165 family protein [Kangiellaceae bacterium]|nr:DUF2165 family protein [Kangiellaceae bacterium]
MHIRYLKIMFAALTGLMALIYVGQNFMNVSAAHQAIIYVMSGADHAVYTHSFGPKFDQPMMAWVAIIIIFSLEIITGVLLFKGVWDMWKQRKADSASFEQSKKWAQIGSGMGILVWFGLFGVIGAAFFQMWQTQVGTGSMNGAFQYFASCAFTLLFLNQSDK